MIIPQMTTVKNPVEEMGIHAVKMLLTMIFTQKETHAQRVFEPELFLRETTRLKAGSFKSL
jgi:DNA-binding LacI/PurR family transcriptional regulator